MGNNLKRPVLVFWAAGEALSSWAESPSTSVSRSMATQAQRHRARRYRKSETATFANGWLTKMIKARLHLQQSGPD
jgi:hypothetical protein